MKIRTLLLVAVIGLIGMVLGGCTPYQVPHYEEIKTSETAFLIPLEGNTKDGQSMFDSESYLAGNKVTAKRVMIPQRWNQTGRLWLNGEWIPMQRLVKVDRTPVTRQWSADKSTPAHVPKEHVANGALWIESSDSIGFSMGFNCTAYIALDDTAKFLFWYKGDSLSQVMDEEIRGRFQQDAAEVAAKYPLDALRAKKQEIVDHIRTDIVPFFATRGVVITTVGMFGGMTYENPDIQKSIDQTIITQQEKVNAKALLDAQADKNARIEQEALALAKAAQTKAGGEAEGKYEIANKEADGKLKLAEAEATGIRKIAEAINATSSTEGLLKLRALEVEKVRAEKWGGSYPQYYFNSGGGTNQMPMPNIIIDGRR